MQKTEKKIHWETSFQAFSLAPSSVTTQLVKIFFFPRNTCTQIYVTINFVHFIIH